VFVVWRIYARFIVACSCLMVLGPCVAEATPAGGVVILGFGSSYPTGDGSAVHRGVDVRCDDGAEVTAPLAGEVSFVGRVPSAAGGTMLAITLVTEQGSVTLMPFTRATVSRGERVVAGSTLGRAAGTGDPSSADSHLHVGLKRGGMYLDPAGLLAAVAGASTDLGGESAEVAQPADAGASGSTVPAASPAVALVTSPGSAPAGSPGTVPTAMGRGVQVTSAQGSQASSGVSLSRAGARDAGQGVDALEPADVQASETPASGIVVALSGSSVPALPGVGLPVAYAPPVSPLVELARAAVALLADSPRPGPFGLAALGATIISLGALFSMRTLRRRVVASPVSDRLGYLLQHLKAGDTLRGLTSCSGPLPSQSRGRIAQGR
jgi:hypothetical protein